MSRPHATLLVVGCIAIGVALGFGARSLRKDTRETGGNQALGNAAEPSAKKGGIEAQPKEEELFSRIVSTVRNRDVLAGHAELFRLLANMQPSTFPGLIERAEKLPLKFRRQMVAAIFS